MEDRRSKTVGKQWERGHFGPPLDARAGELFEKRKRTMENPVFLDACKRSGVEPTARQARKWNTGRGRAYKLGRGGVVL